MMIMQDDDEAEGREVDVENEDGELIMIIQDDDDDEVEEGREVDVENEDGELIMIMQDEDDDMRLRRVMRLIQRLRMVNL